MRCPFLMSKTAQHHLFFKYPPRSVRPLHAPYFTTPRANCRNIP
jgi:hypothetical protein